MINSANGSIIRVLLDAGSFSDACAENSARRGDARSMMRQLRRHALLSGLFRGTVLGISRHHQAIRRSGVVPLRRARPSPPPFLSSQMKSRQIAFVNPTRFGEVCIHRARPVAKSSSPVRAFKSVSQGRANLSKIFTLLARRVGPLCEADKLLSIGRYRCPPLALCGRPFTKR